MKAEYRESESKETEPCRSSQTEEERQELNVYTSLIRGHDPKEIDTWIQMFEPYRDMTVGEFRQAQFMRICAAVRQAVDAIFESQEEPSTPEQDEEEVESSSSESVSSDVEMASSCDSGREDSDSDMKLVRINNEPFTPPNHDASDEDSESEDEELYCGSRGSIEL